MAAESSAGDVPERSDGEAAAGDDFFDEEFPEPQVPEDELSSDGDEAAPQDEPDEEPLPLPAADDGGSMLSFPSDWEEDEAAAGAPATDAGLDAGSQPGHEDDDGAEESEAESLDLESEGVVLLEGSEADLIEEEEEQEEQERFDGFGEFGEGEPPPPPQAESSPADEEDVDEGPSELENLLGNLESDPREDRDMSLHLANDPLAAFEPEEPRSPAAPTEDEEESLDFLLGLAKSEIAAKHTDEPADKSGDILDSLLGDVADLPPPPPDAAMFTAPPPKKKKGFLSKLFGDD